MSEPLRVAVVGLGYWGPNLLRNLVELAEAEVVTMCDLDAERLEHWGRRYPAIDRTPSYMDVLSDDRVEAVVIATPVSTALRPRLPGACGSASTPSSRSRSRPAPRRRASSCARAPSADAC